MDTAEGAAVDAVHAAGVVPPIDIDGTTPGHPLVAAVGLAQAALTEAASDSGWSLSDGEVVAALASVLAVRSSVEAVTASLVAQADTRGVRAQLGQASTAGWLRRRFQLSAREAGRLTTLADGLGRWLGVAGALAAGRVGVEAAAVITTVLADLPAGTSAADATRAEELLITHAATLDPDELATCGRALQEALTVPRMWMTRPRPSGSPPSWPPPIRPRLRGGPGGGCG